MKWFTLSVAAAILMATGPVSAIEPAAPGKLSGYISIGASPDFLDEWVKTGPEHAPTVPLVREFSW